MVKVDWFKGVFPALVTPFDEKEDFDEEKYRALIRYVLPHVNGVVPCGTTGEFVYMSHKERNRAIEIAVEECKGKARVVAGTGASSTKETIELTKAAKDLGADAALVVSPFYFKPTYNELYEHYQALDDIGIPLILYNIPQCSGTHKEWWTTEGLADLKSVIGIKDSSGIMPFMMSLFEKVKGKIAIFCGHDEIGSAALAAGADGVILASANMLADIWQDIYNSTKKGDFARASELQKSIQKITRIVVRQGGNEAVKEGLNMMGVPVGRSRRPVMPGDSCRREDREELRLELEGLGKIAHRKITYKLPKKTIETTVPSIPETPKVVDDWTMRVGEGYAGPPLYELAHVDLLIGLKGGPVEKAMDKALEMDKAENKLRIINDRPKTLLVPTITVRTKKGAEHIYNHATSGVNRAIDLSKKDGFLPEALLDEVVMIANVFVHPSAANVKRINFNNYKAARYAIRKAIEARPTLEELIEEKECARHPFRYTP